MNNSRVRDGEATKRKIIKTAEKLFAKKGFNGVSIRDLANACGMSGPLILHHFKNKDGIYDAVRLALIEEYIPLFEKDIDDNDDLYVFIEKIVRAAFSFHRKNPIALRLMDWDRLNGLVKPWPKSDDYKRMLTERLQRAVDSGEISKDISPQHFGIMLNGMVHLWWEYHNHIVIDCFKKTSDVNGFLEADEEYIQQILLFVRKSLKA